MTFNKSKVLGFAAGIAAGVSYGMNPLFAKPLLDAGVPVITMLFFRYFLSVLMLGVWMLLRGESFRVSGRELRLLAVLGLLFSCSSLLLFESYRFIPSGLATTIVYLYPVFVALMMVALGNVPDWHVWVSIAVTFIGVVILCEPAGGAAFNWLGLTLAAASALSYACYLVIVNRSRRIRRISEHTLTFYALIVGSVLFLACQIGEGGPSLQGIDSPAAVGCLLGLAVFPTMISLLALAVATRHIGPTRTSVLGVFEPVTAILIGTVLFAEPMRPNVLVGVGLCLTAIVFMVVTEHASRTASA
ncbi:MAG: DMT family transporter [Bacteroidales bacterium]|nr:DMT family transporter [Bacteroidales bacterium]